MRELLTRARERFGSEAARYKTREELLVALGLAAGSPVTPVAPTGGGEADVAVHIQAQPAVEPGELGSARGATQGGARVPALKGTVAEASAPALVVRDFFLPRPR
ncbi:MAG: hypothetical protein SFW67_26475 [Myxococcaceae bacterium]|nr:hypothetical protein [Myxococcaceae bacterium]